MTAHANRQENRLARCKVAHSWLQPLATSAYDPLKARYDTRHGFRVVPPNYGIYRCLPDHAGTFRCPFPLAEFLYARALTTRETSLSQSNLIDVVTLPVHTHVSLRGTCYGARGRLFLRRRQRRQVGERENFHGPENALAVRTADHIKGISDRGNCRIISRSGTKATSRPSVRLLPPSTAPPARLRPRARSVCQERWPSNSIADHNAAEGRLPCVRAVHSCSRESSH